MSYSRVLNMPAYACKMTCLYKSEFQMYLNLPKLGSEYVEIAPKQYLNKAAKAD